MDTLTAFNWTIDQQRYFDAEPLFASILLLYRQERQRLCDGEGRALLIRIYKAIHRTMDITLNAAAPVAHVMVFSAMRDLVWYSLLATIYTAGNGTTGPLLSETASTALINIETFDPLVDQAFNKRDTMQALLNGITWRDQA